MTDVPDPYGPATPINDDDRRWQKEADDARHDSLKTVRAEADGWSKTISALLGGFALVTLFAGPEALKEVPSGSAGWLVVAVVLVAALFVIVATALAADAANGTHRWVTGLNATDMRLAAATGTVDAIRKIQRSKFLAYVAVVLVFVTSLIAWLGYLSKPDPVSRAVVSTRSGVMCGTLSTGADGVLNVTPDGGAAIPVVSVTMTAVASCPK